MIEVQNTVREMQKAFMGLLVDWTQLRKESLSLRIYQATPKTKKRRGTSLVVQWLRIRLTMQGTRVRSLVWEDPTCRGATKPVCYNY